MLVCNVSLGSPRRAIATDLAEPAAAIDATDTGNLFATLVDDPASVNETLDAYLGEIMLEMATAIDNVSIGLVYATTIGEAVTAGESQDGTISPALTWTWNPSDSVGVGFTNSNLTITGTTTNTGARSTRGVNSGKYYAEFTANTWVNGSTSMGISTSTAPFSAVPSGQCSVLISGNINLNGSNTGSTLGPQASGHIIGMAVDFTALLIWLRVAPSGNWNGSGTANPATGTGGINISSLTGSLFAWASLGAASEAVTANFGASSFSGILPSGFAAMNTA